MSSMQRTRAAQVHDYMRVLRRGGKLVLAAVFLSALTVLWLGMDGRVAWAEANVGPEIEVFAAQLSGADEASPNTEVATGRAVMTVVTDTLHYRVSVADIENITAAHIHEGPPGMDGPIIFTLYDGDALFDATQPVSGTLTLTPTQKSKLQAGDYYVNVHTTDYSGGEIRGQLEAMALETDYNALLLGRNEVEPVATAATGIANFTLIPTDTYTLTYHLAVSEIMSITAAHIHRGPAGKNGPVVYGLYTGVGPFDPANPVSGTVNLNARDLLDLLTGYFYVNVHTTANPGGEIRGQMGGPRLFAANLNAANETASVESIASGRAVLALNRDTTQLTYRVLVDDIQDIQAAHIHHGAFGVDGPVIFPLYNQGGGVEFDPAHPISGTLAITTGQVLDLIADRYYINVHTPQYGGGEIRGQVMAFTPPTHLNAALTGEGEPDAVETDAVGIGRLTLDGQNMVLHHTVVITDIVDVTAAHIHLGPRGVNGPVIFPLFDQAGGGVFGPDNPVGGGHNLNAANLVDLLTGFYYINVHTSANPGGEIRGQIGGAQIYQASLSGAEEVEPVETIASGRGVLALSADTTSLVYRVTVNRIEDVIAAHIHRGARGVNGGVIFGLFSPPGIFDPQHPVSGTITVNANQVLDLIAGNYYVNVHTTAHTGGEMRGQVEPHSPRSHLHAVMDGAQEVTPNPASASATAIDAVDTDAVGLARLTLDDELSMVRYSLAVTDIVDIIAAHIHFAPAGVSGPVRYTLYSDVIPFAPGESIGDAAMFDAAGWVDLLTGYHYVNVHTAEHPAGEIRGQLGGASLFQAQMTGDKEVPPVETPAMGEAVIALSADTTQLSYRVQVEDIDNIIAAHIHKAPPGVDGDIVITLHDGSTAFTTDIPISATIPVSTTQLFDLLQGTYYVNVHTTAEAGGEIRGQIEAYEPPSAFVATLTADAEVQPSQVNPGGTSAFYLDPALGLLYYSVVVTNVNDITAAHIHRAPVGVNGPVIFFLYDGSGLFDAEHPVGGLHLLDGPDLVDLLTGYYYVNVHTEQQPSGAIRGQIGSLLQTHIPVLHKESAQ